MSSRFNRSRALTVGVSCLVHAALITSLLLAERFIISAHASRPRVLPIELTTLAEAPAPEPVREQAPPPKQSPKKILRLPKAIEPPPPQMIEAATDPRPEPPPPPVPVPPPTPAVSAPAPSASPSSDPAPAPPARATAPAGTPLAVAADGPSAPTGLPAGKTTGLPTGNETPGPAAPGLSTAVAAIPDPKDASSGGGITRYARPQGGYQVRPSYPSSARRLGIQGTTMLKVHVLNDGRVGDVLVEQSAGHPDLDQAATAAVRQWRFDPARRGDDLVAMWVLLPVEFRLR